MKSLTHENIFFIGPQNKIKEFRFNKGLKWIIIIWLLDLLTTPIFLQIW